MTHPTGDHPGPSGPLSDLQSPRELTTAALEAEIRALMARGDQAALNDPLSLGCHLDDRIVRRPHLDVISSTIARLSPVGGDRVLVICPPQVGKTWLACWSVFWWLVKYPQHRVIIGSYGTTLASDRGRSIRRMVETYGSRYGLELMKGAKSVTNWSLISGGGCRSAGVAAGITGNPADCFLIDDPVRSRADAESRIIRDQIWDWWSGDVNSRLAPGAPVVLVQTRWHTDDLAGRLMAEEGTIAEGGRWQVVYLPAFAVPADPERGIPPDSLGRSPGQPLTHPRIEILDTAGLVRHWEDKRRSATARDWAALWQGDPRPVEGALVTRTLMRDRHDYFPVATPIKQAVAVDPAGEGRDNVGIVAGWLGDDLRMYVSHDRTQIGGTSTEKWTAEVVRLAVEIDADRIIYEQNYGRRLIERVITVAWEDAQRKGTIPADALMPQLVAAVAKKNKRLRAEPVAQLLVVDKIRLAAKMPELETQWTTWVPTDPVSPGNLDAMVYLAYNLLRPRRGRRAAGQNGVNPGSVSRTAVAAAATSVLTTPVPRPVPPPGLPLRQVAVDPRLLRPPYGH
jgi:hypothetical protein